MANFMGKTNVSSEGGSAMRKRLLAVVAAVTFLFVPNSVLSKRTASGLKDDSVVDAASFDELRATALRKLITKHAAGAPFAIQEVELLDAFEAGLPLASIEADAVVARVLYKAYVAGE